MQRYEFSGYYMENLAPFFLDSLRGSGFTINSNLKGNLMSIQDAWGNEYGKIIDRRIIVLFDGFNNNDETMKGLRRILDEFSYSRMLEVISCQIGCPEEPD